MKLKLISLLLLLSIAAGAQRSDKKLHKKIEAAIEGFGGDIGVYIHNLENDKTVSINADTIFPTASIVKIPILLGVMNGIQTRRLNYDQELVYRDSLLYAGVDLLGSFKDSEKVELSKVVMLMLTMSDNTASLWLQKLAGTGTAINQVLDSMGFRHTRVNSRTEGRMEDWRKYGWGQTTPREMAMLMKKIVDAEAVSREKSEKMLRLLGRNYWDDISISQIPADVFVASKNGAVNGSRSEILFVNGKGNKYLLSVFTKNISDQSWQPGNEAWMLMRKISKITWDHFNN